MQECIYCTRCLTLIIYLEDFTGNVMHSGGFSKLFRHRVVQFFRLILQLQIPEYICLENFVLIPFKC